MGIFQVADKGLNCAKNIYAATKEADPVTGQDVVKAFSVTEKRIVSYNPALARKQKTRFGKWQTKPPTMLLTKP